MDFNYSGFALLTFTLFALDFTQKVDSFEVFFSTKWFQFFLNVAGATPQQLSGLFHTSRASTFCTEPVKRPKCETVSIYRKPICKSSL